MSIDILNSGDTAGIAGSNTDTVTQLDPLITGDHPPVVTTDEWVADSQDIPANTPVKFSSGKIVPATDGTPAIGLTVAAVVTGASSTVRAPIYRQGVFNPDRINWPVSYTTAEKKRLAFEGAASPTAIVIRKPVTFTPPAA